MPGYFPGSEGCQRGGECRPHRDGRMDGRVEGLSGQYRAELAEERRTCNQESTKITSNVIYTLARPFDLPKQLGNSPASSTCHQPAATEKPKARVNYRPCWHPMASREFERGALFSAVL